MLLSNRKKIRIREIKLLRHPLTKLLVSVLLIVPIFYFSIYYGYAAATPWTQTDWSGGGGQANWSSSNKFSSSTNIKYSTPNQLSLNDVSSQNEMENTGFEDNLINWSTGVQPNAIPNLKLWLKADSLSLSDGDVVGTWPDSSGNGNNATQTSTNLKPIYKTAAINNKPAVRFDGNDDILETPSFASFAEKRGAVFVVFQNNTTKNPYGSLISTYVGVSPDWLLYSSLNGALYKWYDGAFSNTTDPDISGKWYEETIHRTGDTTLKYYQDGEIMNAYTIADQQYAPNIVNIGGTSFGGDLKGDIAEVLVYNELSDTGRQDVEAYLQGKYGIDSGYGKLTHDTSVTHAGSVGSAKIVATKQTDFTQSVNVGDSDTYNLSAYAYTDGSAIDENEVQLFANGNPVSTTYTKDGTTGWYHLTGTTTGVNASVGYGVQVEAGRTVYLDDLGLAKSTSAGKGILVSSIFDTGQESNWGSLTYSATTPSDTAVSVKIRTSNDPAMSGAPDFSSCPAIPSDTDISSNTCVSNSQQYAQYEIILTNTDSVSTPILSSLSLSFAADTTTLRSPVNLTGTPAGSRIHLSWDAPPNSENANIVDYIIEGRSNGGNWSTFSDSISTETTATVSGLTDGVTYEFRVSAVNSVKTGPPSNSVFVTAGSLGLADTFTGASIDPSKWVESDSATNGAGGAAGNVQQNGALNVTGNSVWGDNGLKSVDAFDRNNGDISIESDIANSNCPNGGVAVVGVGYGNMAIEANSGDAYIVAYNGGSLVLYYFHNGVFAGAMSTGFSCSSGVPFHVKLVILKAGGSQLYVNHNTNPDATLSGGTFTNQPIFLQSWSPTATATYNNLQVTLPTTALGSPSNLSVAPGDKQVHLSWAIPNDNGSAITDYIIEYKSGDDDYQTFNDGQSTSTSAIVTGLTNGLTYTFRALAVNANGTSLPSETINATPITLSPTAPTAISVSIIGSAAIGETLKGSYIYADPNNEDEGVSRYRWLRADAVNGTYSEINGGNSLTYTIASTDLNKYLKFGVTPISTVAPTDGTAVLSSATSQVGPAHDYLNHILSTGQSLSVGYNGAPALSTTQPYNNVMLNGSSLVPLIESGVESMSSSMANTLTSLVAGNNYQVAVTRNGVSSTAYAGLKKGTVPYQNGLDQITAAKAAAEIEGKSYRVIGVTTIHGESDQLAGTGAYYEGYLAQWQHDYETDIKAITGQVGTIPLFTDQMSSQTGYSVATSLIPMDQLAASEDYPGKVILVGPKYFFNYADTAHLNNTSYRWLGEYYGKVIKKVVVDHQVWKPLSPVKILRNGNVIYAKFNVPAPPIVFDTSMVGFKANYGFEYADDSSSASISHVEITGPDTVKITLNTVPTGTNQELGYAYTGTPGSNPGAHVAGSVRGNLRDSDPTISLAGDTLYNWSVQFDKPIALDQTAPTITTTLSPNQAIYKGNYQASVNFGDATTNKEYKLDSGDWTIYSGAVTVSNEGSHTLDARGTDDAGNTGNATQASFTINKTSPIVTDGMPSGTLNSSVTSATLAAATSEDATCKYSTTPNTDYESMSYSFSTTGGTTHRTIITGLNAGKSYSYYIRCLDTVSNKENTDDYLVSFSIANRSGDNPVVPSLSGQSSKPISESDDKDKPKEEVKQTANTPNTEQNVGSSNSVNDKKSGNNTNESIIKKIERFFMTRILRINGQNVVKMVKVQIVNKNNKPIPNLAITIHSKTQTAKTNSNGVVTFSNIPVGKHILAFNYKDESFNKRVSVADPNAKVGDYRAEILSIKAEKDPTAIWVWIVITILSISVLTLLMKQVKSSRSNL